MNAKDTAKTEAIAQLKGLYKIRPGTKVYTTVRHVSRSGMSRIISLFVVNSGEIFPISGLVAKACGYPLDRDYFGIKFVGCGMDMCFEAVYTLGRVLFPNGFEQENGETRQDGGYALRKDDL